MTARVEGPTAVDPTERGGCPSELLLEDCVRVLNGRLYCRLIGQDETIADSLWRVNRCTEINDMEAFSDHTLAIMGRLDNTGMQCVLFCWMCTEATGYAKG